MKARMRANIQHRNPGKAVRCLAMLLLTGVAALASPVRYTFEATTRAELGSPSHVEAFDLVGSAFLPVVENGPLISFLANDPAFLSCVSCVPPPIPALHFLRSASADLIQFVDSDGINRPYFFPVGALSSAGTWSTQPGINVNHGMLVVSSVPEPATAGALFIGLTMIAAAGVIRKRSTPVRHDRHGLEIDGAD